MKLLSFLVITLLLPLSFMSVAQAQSAASPDNHSNAMSPRDYGAGYQIVVFTQHDEHAAIAGRPVKLDRKYPVIVSKLTPEAKAFNANMQQRAATWWAGMKAPKDNKTASDPNTDYSLDCEPVGAQPRMGDYIVQPDERMLPGVISVTCGSYVFPHNVGHGGGKYWGFNWLVREGREVKPSDIFNMKTHWLAALTALADADRAGHAPWAGKMDFSNTSHWVVETKGLGLAYSMAEFTGYIDGGSGDFDLISWTKLTPYLRKDGIVPTQDRIASP
jgi:hypothetical protein